MVQEYGTLFYPPYIYEYLGGWNTIKQIYNNFSVSGNSNRILETMLKNR